MKTNILFLATVLLSSVLVLSCQKDVSLNPELSVEQTMGIADEPDNALMLASEDPHYDIDILSHNPDPFYTYTKIKFIIRKTSKVSLSVINMQTGLGEKMFSGTVNKGVYYKLYDGTNKSAGKYLVTLDVDGRLYKEIMTKKNINDPMPVGDDDY